MGTTIPVTGLAASDPVPGIYPEINFGTGPAGGYSGTYGILIIGNKTSAGSATVDTTVYGPSSDPPLLGDADCRALFGPGSEIHRMYRRIAAVNPSTPIFAIAAAENGSGVVATRDVTFTTTATAAGVARFWCEDEYVDAPIVSGDTVTTIAAAVKVQINNQAHWPITADNSSGVLTATSKNKGTRNNQIRVWAQIIGTGVGTTVDVVAPTVLQNGATDDSWTNVLAAILPDRFYYIVCPSIDTGGTTLDDLVTQVNLQAQPITNIRQRVCAGAVGTQSAGSTVAATLNHVRTEIFWQKTSDWTAGELAAQGAAILALFEEQRPEFNFNGFGKTQQTQAYWKVPAQKTRTAWPTRAEIRTAMDNGLSPIATLPNGQGTYLVSSVTTRHKNGSNFDYRVRESHIVSVADRFTDDLVAIFESRFAHKSLGADVPPGQPLPGPNVVTPRIVKSTIFGLIDLYAANDRLKNVQQIKDGVAAVIDSAIKGRQSNVVPLQAIDLLHQLVLRIDDVSSLPTAA